MIDWLIRLLAALLPGVVEILWDRAEKPRGAVNVRPTDDDLARVQRLRQYTGGL